MDEEDLMNAVAGYTGDPILDRGRLLVEMATALGDVKDPKARALLLKYMTTVEGTVKPRTPAELHVLEGGKIQ